MKLFIIFFVYFIIEFTYLSFVQDKYKSIVTKIQSGRPAKFDVWPYGILSYILLFTAFWYFFIYDVHIIKSKIDVFIRATVLALAIYGVFDLTLLVLFDKYTLFMALIDIFYGIFIFNVVGFLAYFLN